MSDPLERWRSLLQGVTPGPWAVVGDALVTRDVVEVDMERVLIADIRYFTIPRHDANTAHIVRSDRLARLLSEEATVEKLARVLCAEDGEQPSIATAESMGYMQEARACLNHLAQLALGDGT